MAKIIYTLVHNRKGKLLQDGTAPISVCAYLHGKRKYFAVDIKIKPEQWDKKRQKIKPNSPNYIQRNTYLTDFMAEMERYELEQIAAGLSPTLEDLAVCLRPKEDKTDFFAFFKNETAKKKNITYSTKQVYNSTYKHLTDFRPRIKFADLTFHFITDFENHLRSNGINTNSAGKYLKTLKTIINLAINYRYMDINDNPFRNYKIKTQPTTRTYLDPSEIKKIEDLEIPTTEKNLSIVRDMYLFSIYSGLRFSDIVKLSPANLQTLDRKKYLVLNMEKTKETLRLPIYLLFDGKPVEMLERYTDPTRPLFFENFTNQFVNRELKEIARLAGITKLVTFHTARHATSCYSV